MASTTTVKTIGSTGTFSTPQLWEDGAPASLTTAERSACGTFAVTAFVQGENLTFVGSGATGKFLDTDSTGPGTGSYITYGITTGNPAASDVVTGTSTATCILTSGTPDFTGVIWQGQCQNQEFSGTGIQLVISASTASATAYKELTTVSGASFRDHGSVQTNALRYNAANGCGIRGTSAATSTATVGESFARITNLQMSATGADSGSLIGQNATDLLFSNCLVEGTRTTADPTNTAVLVARQTGNIVKNCVIIQRASGAAQIISTGTGTPSFYNCTVVSPDDLATAPTNIFNSGASGTVTVQNCGIFAGDAASAIKTGSATFNFTTCYSDISGTGGVTQTTYANEFQDVNDSTRDFRLKTGAAQIDTGTTDATNAAIDIAKTNRPSGAAYDVGAWELVTPNISSTLSPAICL